VATTDSTRFQPSLSQSSASTRNLAELILGFLAIDAVLWLPTHEQLIFGPIALLAPFLLVLWRRPGLDELGLGWRGFAASLWILPAAVVLSVVGVDAAKYAGTFHTLYAPDLSHVGGYVFWTLYQQFLLQDFFMPRLSSVLSSNAAIGIAAVLFALAHLPNIPLVLATLVWGAVSCALFRRYRNLYVLGLAQGLLGLCFAVCVPDVWLHQMRVGLGYLRYHPMHS
jgi:membrane protease YdiL (CAAX protease family)